MYKRGIIPELALVATLSAALSFAQPAHGQVGERVSDRFPAGSIRSIAEADAALQASAGERIEIEARYLAEEQACHPKFFTTSCIEQSKERRRVSMSALRALEIEANAFKRQARLAERDKALAERLEKAGQERQESRGNQPDAEFISASDVPRVHSQNTSIGSKRVEEREVKMLKQKPDGVSDTDKRVANVAAYEKKKSEALKRQQKVALRKAEKEEKRKVKQAEESKPE